MKNPRLEGQGLIWLEPGNNQFVAVLINPQSSGDVKSEVISDNAIARPGAHPFLMGL
jgi:hypothetical protein